MTKKQEILRYVQTHHGCTAQEILRGTNITRIEQVNQNLRNLFEDGILRRDKSARSYRYQIAGETIGKPIEIGNRREEVENRVADLCNDFTACLEYFNKSERFTGPSVYFHLKTLDRLRELGSPLKAAQDERFCELLYATLVAWGMHRMEKKGAKMPDFKTFADSIGGLAPEIEELSHYRIITLSPKDTSYIVGKLWPLIARLEGSTTKSKLVANSKILHHLLPHLAPPIDRNNAAIFFKFNTQGHDERAFEFIFPKMVSIAKSVKATLGAFDYHGFNSSETKVIDNAVIGYVLKNGLNVKGKPKKSTGK